MEDINDDKIECSGGGILDYINRNAKTYTFKRMSSIELLEAFGEIEAKTGRRTPKVLIDFIANIED